MSVKQDRRVRGAGTLRSGEGWPRWVWIVIAGALITGGLALYLAWNRMDPFNDFWSIDEDAWLGFVGSILSAGIGGLVAGLILRAQLKRQEVDLHHQLEAERALQREALDVQRDEARREREIAVIVDLISFLRESTLVSHGFFTSVEASRYTDIMFRWQMNNGLASFESEEARRLLRLHLQLLGHVRYRTEGTIPTGSEFKAFQNRKPPAGGWLPPEALEELQSVIGDLIKTWVGVPNMSSDEKRELLSNMKFSLDNWSQNIGILPRQVYYPDGRPGAANTAR